MSSIYNLIVLILVFGKKQTDYQFGFVPLSNLVLPDNPGHIGDKVDNPNIFGSRPLVSQFLGVHEFQSSLS